MSHRYRHLEIPSDTPPEELPAAAIVDTLERGDLEAWRPLAAAVARNPSGPFARRVTRLIDAYPMYGVSPLWRAWIDRCRARAEGAEHLPIAAGLAALRKEMELTQSKLAGRIGMSQSDLSKLERRRDVRLSTLRAYTEALGGRRRVLFDAGGVRMEIRIGQSD